MKEIILNGKISNIPTGDEAGNAIGIVDSKKINTFSGGKIETQGVGFILSKEMYEHTSWMGKFACVRFHISDKKINPNKVTKTLIESITGAATADYSHKYSEFTGYLWTDEEFKVGGHDILQILQTNLDKYIHMEIDMYEKGEVPKHLIKEKSKAPKKKKKS